jgi:NitT/TauT family transport system substrate-binding protein
MVKFAAVIAISVASLAVSHDAPAADKVRVGKSTAISFTFIQPEVGTEAGIWEKYAIEPNVSTFGGDAKMQQALAAGSLDFALGSGPGMGFMAKGVPAKGVAAFLGPPIQMAVVVRYDSAIKNVVDLKGKKVGVTTVDSLTDWLTRRVSLAQGWGSNGISVVTVGAGPSAWAALRTNQIDGIMTNTDIGRQLQQKKEGRILVGADRYVSDFHTLILFASDEMIAKRPEVVQRFVNGFFATIAFMKRNKEKTVEVGVRVMKQSKENVSVYYDEVVSKMSDDGRFDPKAIEVLKDSFLEMKVLEKRPDDSTLFTTRFVPAKR